MVKCVNSTQNNPTLTWPDAVQYDRGGPLLATADWRTTWSSSPSLLLLSFLHKDPGIAEPAQLASSLRFHLSRLQFHEDRQAGVWAQCLWLSDGPYMVINFVFFSSSLRIRLIWHCDFLHLFVWALLEHLHHVYLKAELLECFIVTLETAVWQKTSLHITGDLKMKAMRCAWRLWEISRSWIIFSKHYFFLWFWCNTRFQ